MRILYVEDEKYLADAVVHLLKKSDIAVDWVADGEAGLELALKPNYDCLVLDIMLPKLSGLEVLQAVRRRGITTPVIMLSALAEVDDKVHALEAGADDYLAKPFKVTELAARLKALQRRPPLRSAHVVKYADLEYNVDDHTLNQLPLTAKEAELAEILLRYPERVQSKEQLLARVWGNEANVNDNYVEVYVSYLRKKLKELHSSVRIKTIRNLGYKLTSKA